MPGKQISDLTPHPLTGDETQLVRTASHCTPEGGQNVIPQTTTKIQQTLNQTYFSKEEKVNGYQWVKSTVCHI